MLCKTRSFLLASAALFPSLISAQLAGSVGPTTSYAEKKAVKVCDVTDYGASADGSTDISTALTDAWNDCKSGGVVYVPAGDYALSTWVSLSGGAGVAIQIDGIITRTAEEGGNMIFVQHSSDIEFFSSTGAGGIQGLGYEYHSRGDTGGPRLLRFYDVTDFSVHDFLLVDSPLFHLSLDTCANGELYNLAIRGGNMGGLDGIDVWSTNIWVHDVTVTNKDECVTVKSPSKNILVENVWCNWSGGCAFGSLGAGTNISDVVYSNVYTVNSNQVMMIKSNGGSGTVSNVLFENFIGHGNAYSLNVDQYWSSMDPAEGDGVQLNNITFNNWKGTCASGTQRGPMQFKCADGAPCTDMTVTDFAMWTDTDDEVEYICRSAYGSGGCLVDSDGASYDAVTTAVAAAPSGYEAASMDGDLTTDFGTDRSIPMPTLPASYFPSVSPYSAANSDATCVSCGDGSDDAAADVVANTTTVASPSLSPSTASVSRNTAIAEDVSSSLVSSIIASSSSFAPAATTALTSAAAADYGSPTTLATSLRGGNKGTGSNGSCSAKRKRRVARH